jgi:molybdopterin converting factor small subunit
VLLFARYAELLGRDRVELPADGSGPWPLRTIVARVRALPGGDAIPAEPLVALNLRQAALDDPAAPGDEVALLPPLSGG